MLGFTVKVLVDVEKEEFKRKFPHLAKELDGKTASLQIDAFRTHVEKASRYMFQGYNPTAVDYLRKCDTEKQAAETIDYLERNGEIDKAYAEELRKQLKEKGLRSFGPKKDDDYSKEAGYG